MDIWKVNEFNFLNEEIEEFTSRWSLNLVTVKCPRKPSNIVYEAKTDYCVFGFSFGHGDVL